MQVYPEVLLVYSQRTLKKLCLLHDNCILTVILPEEVCNSLLYWGDRLGWWAQSLWLANCSMRILIESLTNFVRKKVWLPIVVELIALQGMETLRDHAFRAPQSPAIHQDDNDCWGEQYTEITHWVWDMSKIKRNFPEKCLKQKLFRMSNWIKIYHWLNYSISQCWAPIVL